jgi:hypothetical protein
MIGHEVTALGLAARVATFRLTARTLLSLPLMGQKEADVPL